jgi:hypothetical protein
VADEPQSPPDEALRQFAEQFVIPEFYADGLAVETSPFTVSLNFSIVSLQSRRPVGTVRMSPAHAKLATILLKRIIKEAESKWGMPIDLPPGMLADRQIDLERDW